MFIMVFDINNPSFVSISSVDLLYLILGYMPNHTTHDSNLNCLYSNQFFILCCLVHIFIYDYICKDTVQTTCLLLFDIISYALLESTVRPNIESTKCERLQVKHLLTNQHCELQQSR